MNIIPLVTTFIIIIGMFSLAQMQSIKHLRDEKRIYITQQKLAGQLRNKLAENHYQKVIKPKFTDNSKKDPYSQNKALTSSNQRLKEEKNNDKKEFIHFEIAPLITNSQSVNMAKKWMQAMTLIYSEFPKKDIQDLCKSILDAEKALYKKDKTLTPLVKLALKDERQAQLLFKLLKGPPITKAPSLLSITSITKDKKHVIELAALEKDFLALFIGDKAAKKARPEKGKPPAASELLAGVDASIKDFINKSTKTTGKKIHQVTDEVTNLTLICNEPH